ncbi:MAG TPA: ribosome biogenesis GTPase Der [Saprospiraceae bacterium]|nr:ribosome biogenesis GTPase Der [Saprospiraceae bacterium]HNT19828.1 ribosome biogenesis GTPase Der [Saprospiraceae bacterium]
MSNIVAIVGRPNVGKSTLFNRLFGERQAIIDDTSGVTRDRIYGECEWNGKNFTIIDTGGFVQHSDDVFEAAVRQQVRFAVDEANAIIFMVDVTTGITDLDEQVANLLRRSNKPVYLAVNKVDNHQRMLMANEFYGLGFDNTYFLSSISGSGVGELLDDVVELFAPEDKEKEQSQLPQIAIIGQPNVGKSTLLNALLGEERNIVTDIPGTTRDSIHTLYNKFGHQLLLVDTAGIRRKTKVHEDLEFYSVIRAIKSLEECDVCLLMIDARHGIEAQDSNLFRLAIKKHKGILILVNKWDLVEKDTNTLHQYEKALKHKLAPFNDLPILFISAQNKQRIFQVVESAMDVYERRKQKIKTSDLNEFLAEINAKNPPPAYKGRLVKIKYVTQVPKPYPAFAFFCNNPDYIQNNYRQYLENQLRERYPLSGIPISIFFKEK